MSFDFKRDYSFARRHAESTRIKEKFPDRIPIIINKNPKCTNLPDITKKKYLVPIDLTVGQFIYVVRSRIELPPEQALFLFVNETLPPTSQTVKDLYENNADEDGFLYIIYTGENVFG